MTKAAHGRPLYWMERRSVLPAAPGAGPVVGEGHADEDEESEYAGADSELGELCRVLHMHEEEHDQDHLEGCDRERDDGVEHAHFHVGGSDGQASHHKEDANDREIDD